MKGFNDFDKMAQAQARQLQVLCAIARKLGVDGGDGEVVDLISEEVKGTLRRLREQAEERVRTSPHIWRD